jgi:hypothetical protein
MLEGQKINWTGSDTPKKTKKSKPQPKLPDVVVDYSGITVKLGDFLTSARELYKNKPSSELFGVIVSTEYNIKELEKLG